MLLEPWLDSVGEAGLQFEVPESGPPKFLGVTPQIVDARGSYRGSLFGATEDQAGWETAVDIGLEVAKRVQAEGYFGPLSLDGMRYRDGDGERLRPLQDLNARWSMGASHSACSAACRPANAARGCTSGATSRRGCGRRSRIRDRGSSPSQGSSRDRRSC